MSEQDVKSLNQARYSAVAESYVTSKTHSAAPELQQLIVLAKPESSWRVLDVATGGGHTARTFAPYVGQVVATDLTPAMLHAARNALQTASVSNAAFAAVDAERLAFNASTFDLVTCRIAAHHFPDIFRFVQECARVLKPGGTLLIQDHVLPENPKDARYVDSFEKLRDPSHVRALTEHEWRGCFLDAGLSVDHVEFVEKRHEFHDWADRQNVPPEVKQRLQAMLVQAPAGAAEWLAAEHAGTDRATFDNRHIIIMGKK